ncbi:MAG: phage integrase SAM-like domain-containing protein, partial [Bryobacteraceae bacterium]
MLTVFRRHSADCPHRSEGLAYRRCRCPLHVEGRLGGEKIRRALATPNWEKAQEIVRQWEAAAEILPEPITVAEAVRKFIADAKDRNLNPATLNKYHTLFGQLSRYAEKRGYRYLKELDTDVVREFRSTWNVAPRTSIKKLERVRAFFRFARAYKWIDENPAEFLKTPLVKDKPTLPFTKDEMIRILVRCSGTLRTFVHVLRFTGLRIGDTALLTTSQVVNGKLHLYTQKTGTPVSVPLPPFLDEELKAIPPVGGRFYFLLGESTRLETVADLWRRKLKRLFKD